VPWKAPSKKVARREKVRGQGTETRSERKPNQAAKDRRSTDPQGPSRSHTAAGSKGAQVLEMI
jgi:hypothetical protein